MQRNSIFLRSHARDQQKNNKRAGKKASTAMPLRPPGGVALPFLPVSLFLPRPCADACLTSAQIISEPTLEIDRRTDRAGGRAARGVSSWSSFRCLRFLGCCVVRRSTNRRWISVFWPQEPRPRSHPDRRPGLCDGPCRAAGLRPPNFHFGHSRLAPGGCRVAPRKKSEGFST